MGSEMCIRDSSRLLRAKESGRNQNGAQVRQKPKKSWLLRRAMPNGDDSMYNDMKNSLDCLRQVVSEGFVKLHTA